MTAEENETYSIKINKGILTKDKSNHIQVDVSNWSNQDFLDFAETLEGENKAMILEMIKS